MNYRTQKITNGENPSLFITLNVSYVIAKNTHNSTGKTFRRFDVPNLFNLSNLTECIVCVFSNDVADGERNKNA